MEKLLEKNLLDPETEIHYAYHKSIKSITDMHDHDFYEIFLITKGTVMHLINGKKERLEAGTLCFVRPSDKHCYAGDGNRSVEMLNLAFSSRMVIAMFAFLDGGIEMDRLLNGPMPMVKQIGTYQTEIIRDKIHEITVLPGMHKKQIRSEIRVLVADIMMSCFSDRPDALAAVAVPDWLVDLANEMRIKENFAEGLQRLYELSGKSPEHLTRVIKKCFGKTPTEWINEIRLQYAANLLMQTDDAIVAICMEAGYENLSHFYHLFKERYDCTPAKFRKGNRKVAIPASGQMAQSFYEMPEYQNRTKSRSV
ncbi:helix-turn-helix domain-containing protein [Paenibacillus sacheonensis]|uniref:Helix-turn-helix domain-containing protein n=1 Tax=Paenibacillus sacheonensis TaxID=742054 RepID=A0A7X5BXV6_9BACL|nr:helix-turn-helix domain-containing protein [Paenibacillus sacheonensis]MBM7565860.1 AraC family cel operon transcriptional repressor [Paenibacillus sacheonensis]NBC68821.1 helix-turn-helix domain-containing protein [Paenibacillus sacheonensis]